jgi:hypothetical protein
MLAQARFLENGLRCFKIYNLPPDLPGTVPASFAPVQA